jgi:hypothetical protein
MMKFVCVTASNSMDFVVSACSSVTSSNYPREANLPRQGPCWPIFSLTAANMGGN